LKARIVVRCLAAALPGCDRGAERAAQLAARVNGARIAVQQVRSAAAGGSVAPASAGAGSEIRPALEKVIDRELLAQQAVQAGLERDAAVRGGIDTSRRQILAQAWLDKVATGRTVSREEIHAFYAENPALFAERRVYRVRETRLVPAEELPLALLPQLARMSPGESMVFETMEVQLVHAERAPLSEAQAAPVIEQFLAGRKRLELAAAEVRRLRELATIEYAGEFKRSN
jgi:predicted transcriptional regulator